MNRVMRWVASHRFNGLVIGGFSERAWRMDHCAINPGRFHLGQRLVVRIRGILAMMGARFSVLPDMDLGIDYQHGAVLGSAAYGYIAQPTRSVWALKKWPFVLVTYSVVMSGPPKQQLVGRFAATGCVSRTRPVGEKT